MQIQSVILITYYYIMLFHSCLLYLERLTNYIYLNWRLKW